MDLEKLKSEKTIHELLEFGIINIDKPSGMTSFDVVEKIAQVKTIAKSPVFRNFPEPMVIIESIRRID